MSRIKRFRLASRPAPVKTIAARRRSSSLAGRRPLSSVPLAFRSARIVARTSKTASTKSKALAKYRCAVSVPGSPLAGGSGGRCTLPIVHRLRGRVVNPTYQRRAAQIPWRLRPEDVASGTPYTGAAPAPKPGAGGRLAPNIKTHDCARLPLLSRAASQADAALEFRTGPISTRMKNATLPSWMSQVRISSPAPTLSRT